MKDHDMTQADLAHTLGISQQAISKKLRYKKWSLTDVTDICEAFNSDYTISIN
jgi:DNA-binding XRE family transcriptional regulator